MKTMIEQINDRRPMLEQLEAEGDVFELTLVAHGFGGDRRVKRHLRTALGCVMTGDTHVEFLNHRLEIVRTADRCIELQLERETS